MNIAGYEISFVNFGNFRLDGGAMFGSVPKNLWGKLIPVDQENCIPMATRSLLLRGHKKVILVDCGNGTKWNEKSKAIFQFEDMGVRAAGINPEEITDLVLTHLHFDHVGGISYYDEKNELMPTFPNAHVWVQRANLENAEKPLVRERASYLPENVSMIRKSKHTLLEANGEILSGISVCRSDGHTKGLQRIEISDANTTLLYPSDLMPTSRHIPIAYHMGYDMCVDTLLREKEEFIEYAIAKNAMIVSEHDFDTATFSIVKNEKGGYQKR